MEAKAKLAADSGKPVKNAFEYRSLVGAPQYLSMTRPDLAHAVQQVCLHMHDP